MSLKDIDIGIKKIKSLLIADMEKQLKLLGITYEKIYTSEEINNSFDVNRKYRRNQILDVLINESEENESGLLLSDAEVREKNIKKFVKECAFDFTNKLCAIRLLEERNLIAPAIKKFKEYGDKSEVQKNLGQVSYSLLDRDSYDGLKYSIEATLRELSTQIKVLFEVNDEHSLLFPEPKTIREIVKILIDDISSEDWQKDDFIGWSYQYFVEDEKEEIEQADTVEEIAAKTQVYTYDWIVKYIVDNTLGTLWNEIKSGSRDLQDVETIKLIDPSCGSGSFLTYAFDKFYDIYLDEGKVPVKEIPNYIISKNIFGMDIDERAVQLAALNLYIKAKQKNINIEIDRFNIICTDSRIKDDVNIDKYLQSISIDPKLREVIKKIVQNVFVYIKKNNVLGSLMKIENIINPIIDEYIGGRRRLSVKEVEAKRIKISTKSDQITLFNPELEQLTLDSIEDIRYFNSRKEFVDYLRQKILDCVEYVITKLNKSNDINSKMFAKDLSRGSNFINAKMQQFHIVVGNPPYLGNRKMGKGLRKVVETQMPESKYDLYIAFMKLNYSLADIRSYIGLITPDTYLSISTLDDMRDFMLNNTYVKTIIHLGKDTFKEAVNACVTIQVKEKRETYDTKIIDLQDTSNKAYYLLDDNENLIESKYFLSKDIILKLPHKKFIYWVSEYLHNILINSKTLEPHHGVAKQGLITGENNTFIYMRWEIPFKLINIKWFPVSKGGGYNKYLGRMDFLINWANDGEDLKRFAKNKYGTVTRTIVGMDHYFKEGITYSKITSESRFSARYLPKGWIFTEAGPCIFPSDYSELNYLLALVNSKIANYLLYCLNPTVNFEIGDINSLPVVEVDQTDKSFCTNYVLKIMNNKKLIYEKYDVLSEVYNIENYIKEIIDSKSRQQRSFQDCYRDYFNIKSKLDIENEEYSYILDEYLFDIYGITDDDKIKIFKKFGKSTITNNIVNGYFYKPQQEDLEKLYSDGINLKKKILKKQSLYIDNNIDVLVDKVKKICQQKGTSVIKIANELEIHPRSLISIMNDFNIYINDDVKEFTKRFVQILVRKVFNNDADGVILLKEIIDKVHDELTELFADNASAIETDINNIIGKDIERWLQDDFATDYLNNKGYNKSKNKYAEIKNPWEPLIWKGQSSKKNFTVFVWRYKITPDTELKIRSQYLENEIDAYKRKVNEIDGQLITLEGREKNQLEKERDQILDILDDLNEYHKWIKENGIKLRGMWFNWE